MDAVSSAPAPSALSGRAAEITQRRDALARRLDDGYRRIEQALAHGEDVRAWEDFWLNLLAEYEAVCDDLREAA